MRVNVDAFYGALVYRSRVTYHYIDTDIIAVR